MIYTFYNNQIFLLYVKCTYNQKIRCSYIYNKPQPTKFLMFMLTYTFYIRDKILELLLLFLNLNNVKFN